MKPFKPVQPVKPEDLERTGEILKSVAGKNRLYTYIQLYQDSEPKHIAQDLDITRNAVQHYITDWKELSLIESENNGYEHTDLGEGIAENLGDIIMGINFIEDDVEIEIEEIEETDQGQTDFFSNPLQDFTRQKSVEKSGDEDTEV